LKVRLLSLSDSQRLLRFELQNQHWFEQFIEPRPEGFLTQEGIEAHLRWCLYQRQHRRMYPMIIEKQSGDIAGRVNLYKVDLAIGNGWLGYRIAESAVGSGLASRAVAVAIDKARKLGLRSLTATASVENIASQRVLIKNGFAAGNTIPEGAILTDRRLDLIEFRRPL